MSGDLYIDGTLIGKVKDLSTSTYDFPPKIGGELPVDFIEGMVSHTITL